MNHSRTMLTVAALALAGVLAGQAAAAIQPVTAVTTHPALATTDTDSDGRYELDADLTSVTIDGNTYSQIAGPSSVIVNGNPEWMIPADEDPNGQTDVDAVSGLQMTSALIDGSAEFYFDDLTLDTVLMIFESDLTNEGIHTYGIDAGGNRLTSDHLFFPRDDAGGSTPNLILVDMQRESGGGLSGRALHGVAFSLRDLGYDESDFGPGELATLAGFEITTSSFDTVGMAMIVPEPATVALLGTGMLMMLKRRRV